MSTPYLPLMVTFAPIGSQQVFKAESLVDRLRRRFPELHVKGSLLLSSHRYKVTLATGGTEVKVPICNLTGSYDYNFIEVYDFTPNDPRAIVRATSEIGVRSET